MERFRPIKGTMVFGLMGLLAFSPRVWAWGDRGHRLICVVATSLIEAPANREFLKERSEMMGHFCNVPDNPWKFLPNGRRADSSHYLNPEKIGVTLKDLPTKRAQVLELARKREDMAKASNDEIFSTLGSLWWRADQFYGLAVQAAESLSAATPPAGREEAKNSKHPFNAAALAMLVNAGILGHFVGDASMPYHTTSDFDGWATGHGGIHSYYENHCVSELPHSLENNVYLAARKLKHSDSKRGVVERMKDLTVLSRTDQNRIEVLDRLQKKSENTNGEKKVAGRERGARACARFEKLIVQEMARSSRLLADFWEEILAKNSAPLFRYQNFEFPLQPDFVEMSVE